MNRLAQHCQEVDEELESQINAAWEQMKRGRTDAESVAHFEIFASLLRRRSPRQLLNHEIVRRMRAS